MDPAEQHMQTAERQKRASVVPMLPRMPAPSLVPPEPPRQAQTEPCEAGEEPGYGHGV
jgi:hypothetical protein